MPTRLILFLLGLLLALLAGLANTLGLDNDPGWGKGRLFLLLSGAALSLSSLLVQLYRAGALPKPLQHAIQAASRAVSALWQRMVGSPKTGLAITTLAAAALVVYGVWFGSAGRFPAFPTTGAFYPQLAEAFLRGQLNLLAQPDPALVALPNPYDMLQRDQAGVKVLWDASLFNGKYYLYWGPVPALILAAVWAITGQRPLNPGLVVFFYVGLVLVLAALLYRFRQRYFPQAPLVSVPLFLLAASLNLPYLFLLGRPSVYEAAIISGQFFLFLGLLGWSFSLDRGQSGWLVLAGLSWGLATGSRTTVLLSVAVFTAAALWQLWRDAREKRRLVKPLAALLAPLALCGLALAGYNYARFGSFTETGVTYQLSLAVPPQQHFSPAFVPSNLYMWLFYPFQASESFPFINYRLAINLQLPAWAPRPPFKMFDREFYGLLPTTPVLWLLVLLVPLGIWALWKMRRKQTPALSSPEAGSERLVTASAIGLGGLLQFGALMGFFYAAMRYAADFVLPAVLTAAFVAWEVDRRLQARRRARAALWLVVTLLALVTAAIGFFGAFTIPPRLLAQLSPGQYQALVDQWTPLGRYAAGITRLARSFLPW